MYTLCATSTALTAAAAATTAIAVGTLGVDLTRSFVARWHSLKEWLLRNLRSSPQ